MNTHRVAGLVLAGFALAATMFSAGVCATGICLQDEVGERIHLDVQPGGLMTGYSEFDGVVTGIAFGAYRFLSDEEVMLGGDVNNDCDSGLYPGKFNARLNVEQGTGSANGFLFLCDGTTVPFRSAIFPCGNNPGNPAPWGAFTELGTD